jgi:CHAT domain-containing protein
VNGSMRPGWSTLGSLINEDLHSQPGPGFAAAMQAMRDDPTHRVLHLIDACYSTLAAGEPNRCLRLLDEFPSSGADVTRHVAALRAWAVQLDGNWYPGGVGAETTMGVADAFVTPKSGQPETVLVEHLLTYGPVALTTARAIVENLLRGGNQTAAQQLTGQAIAGLDKLVELGRQLGVEQLTQWAHIAAADLIRRIGLLEQANARLYTARRAAAAQPDPPAGIVALSHLVEGDWYATPGASPESLGFDLAPQPHPTTMFAIRDITRAGKCYDAASVLVSSLPIPRLRAALDLRRATLAWLADDPVQRRDHLVSALDGYRATGDVAGVHLTTIHLVIADIEEGRLYEHALTLGSGWQPTEHGPIADVLTWAHTDGSRAWSVGLGRLLQRAAEAWRMKGSIERARVGYMAALPLLALGATIPTHTITTALAYLDSRSNLMARALIRLERLMNALPPLDPGPRQLINFAQRIETIVVMVDAHRARSETAAAEHAAQGLERLRGQLAKMLTVPGIAETSGTGYTSLQETQAALDRLVAAEDSGDPQTHYDTVMAGDSMRQMLAMCVGSAREQIALIDVLVPLARAAHAHRRGMVTAAEEWYEVALTAADCPDAPIFLRPLILVAMEQYLEARATLARQDGVEALADEFLAVLSLRAEDPLRAAAAFARSGGAERAAHDWHASLTAAEISLAHQDPHTALDFAHTGIRLFEESITTMLRDTDRLAACDQPDTASLYLTAAQASARLASQAHPGEADTFLHRSFEASERARSLTLDGKSGTLPRRTEWRGWQQIAAEWAAHADRLLAVIDTPGTGDTSKLVNALELADHSLTRAEYNLDRIDPGVLLRRSKPPPPVAARELQDHLAVNTLVLEYLTVRNDLMGWAVSSRSIQVTQHTISSRRLAALVRAFHERCAEGWGTGPEAIELSNLLIAPFADVIRDHHRVVVVPFGPLNLLPFHAFTLDGTPLGQSHVVSYSPSAALITRRNGEFDRPVQPSRPLIVGDPSFDPDTRPGLHRLPGARAEALAVGSILGCPEDDILIDEQATGHKVRTRVPERDVLLLATHGFLDELAPFASSLVLAGADELTVADLVGLHTNATLAVLSGCDTGRGAATLGGDVVGLTRSLLRAGIYQAVVSLWPVDDEVAPVIMRRFFAEIVRGTPPAAALAQAQRWVFGLSADSLQEQCVALGDTTSTCRQRHPRRGDLCLESELLDDDPVPKPLSGAAERYWAPFILVGG